MDPEKRLEAFEKMLAEVQKDYEIAENKMRRLKEEGKEKSATGRPVAALTQFLINSL